MEVFGVGPAELVLILIIVLVIFGPDQLPEIAKKLGSGVREIRHTLDSISNEVDDTVKPIKELMDPNQSIPTAPTAPAASSNLLVADEAQVITDTLPQAETKNLDDSLPTSEGSAETMGEPWPAPEDETINDPPTAPEPPRDDSSQA